MVLVAPFANIEQLTASYRVGGTIPLLDPLAQFSRLMAFLNSFIVAKGPSKDKLASLVRHVEQLPLQQEASYHVTVIHAEDDYDLPWSHSESVVWHAVNASTLGGTSLTELEQYRTDNGRLLGSAGRVVKWRTPRGEIQEVITKYGLHDRIMSYPVVSLAVWRAFGLGP